MPAKRKKCDEKKEEVKKQGTVGGATAGGWETLKVPISDESRGFLEGVKGFKTMAPVQASVIPQMLKGKDVVVEAVTGSGKTMAFLIPVFELIMKKDEVRKLVTADKHAVVGAIMEPTRELAMQVEREAKSYAEHILTATKTDIRVNSFIGGRDAARDVASYEKQGANIIVGTPGRLYEVLVVGMEGISIKCKQIEILILDEADRLLSQGFAIKLDAILERIPTQRRTGLFSATQTNEVKELIRVGMRNPVVIRVQVKKKELGSAKSLQVPDTIENYYRVIKPSKKLEALSGFLLRNKGKKVIVYFLTCACVDFALRALKTARSTEFEALDITLHPLHGQMPLQRRKKLFKEFQTAEGGSVLLCTDVAARGLDVSDIDYVIQIDAPTDPSTFVHRIGRTARMGRKGVSVIYLAPQEASYIDYLKLQKVELQQDETLDGLDTDSEEEDSDEEEEEQLDDEEEDQDVVMKKNVKGGIRFRVKVASHGMRQKFKSKKGKNNKVKPVEAVVVGKPSESEFVYKIRKAVASDRTMTDIAAKAFVTWVRAYRDHSLRYIFKLGRVDVVDLCHAFGLLKLPKMPELAHMQHALIPMEDEFYKVNVKKIVCADEGEEAKRQDRIKAKSEREAVKREEKMSERNKKRELIKDDKTMGKRRKKEAWNKMELDELKDDARLLKKLKQGKITEAEYSKMSGEDDIEFALLPAKERAKLKAKRDAQTAAAQAAEAEQLARIESSSDTDDHPEEGDDDEESHDEQPPARLNIPDEQKSASGHAPSAWIAMIKKKMGKK